MGKFSFPIPGRKKQPPQVTVSEPLSKAHKILGSTPLNIDGHGGWDDAASSIAADDKSDGITPTFGEVDWAIPDNHGASKPEKHWADYELESMPEFRRASATGSETDTGMTETSSDLRKSQSTSTIKSWYDRTNQPLSVSQQTSASAMAKGVPSKAHKMLDVDNVHGQLKKKKPARLDLSTLMPGSRSSRRHDADVLPSATLSMKSPSLLSPYTPPGEHHRESRRLQRRRTKESLRSPEVETPRPHTSASGRLGSGGAQSLYDHYEEMSYRHIMRQDSNSELNVVSIEEESSQAPIQGAEWPEVSIPETPVTARFSKSSTSVASRNRLDSRDSAISPRTRRTSKASALTERNFKAADLQQKSVLLLSSGSEDEGEDEPEPTAKKPISFPTHPPIIAEDGMMPIEEFEESRPKTSRTSRTVEVRGSKANRTRRGSKRTSFAPANTYITIPAQEREAKLGPPDSRSSTPSSQAITPSVRASLISNFSTSSGMTWQSKSGFGIQEARAITMLPARRPSHVELEQNNPIPELDGEPSLLTMPHEPVNTSADQLTPPLSPSSVDFYIRSGRSSIDGPGSHNRIMAVTRQEEMLLSALRHRNQTRSRRGSAFSESEQTPDADKRRYQSPNRPSDNTEKEDSPEPTFDFGFPAPPSFNGQRMSMADPSPASTHRSLESDESHKHLSSGDMSRSLSFPRNRFDASRKASLKGLNQQTLVEEDEDGDEDEKEDIPLYLDEMEPGLDMMDFKELDAVLSSTMKDSPNSPDETTASQWPIGRDSAEEAVRQAVEEPAISFAEKAHLRVNSYSPSNITAPVREETEAELATGVPRPDSPISPDSFPSVPTVRTTIGSIARLSAVGSGQLGSGELGWWGDDD